MYKQVVNLLVVREAMCMSDSLARAVSDLSMIDHS